MEVVHLRSSQGIGLQVVLRQIRDLLEHGETSIFITNGNTTPPSLDGPGLARTDDPETSKIAANKPLGKRRRKVLYWLMQYGPATSYTIADSMGVDRSYVTPRLNELATQYDPPLAYKTGRTFINPKSNRPCEEWEATEIGMIWIRGEQQ